MLKRVSCGLSLALAGAVLSMIGARSVADEGMWLVNKPPVQVLQSEYGFTPSPEWLERMQKSACRLSSGGSGSIVSSDGLVMTNHHVAAELLYELSSDEHNLLEEGFYAKSRDDELKVHNLEVDVLWEIEDVTDRVKGSAAQGASDAEASAARRRAIAEIETESNSASGLQSEVVTLYQGGQYHLYKYKRFRDVRLVFAPEQQAAFFGGDNDNFEYPRYCLDVTFLRLYENDEPYEPQHYLEWSKDGSSEGDLAFVFGHPGSTRRLYTMAHLDFLRDVQRAQTLERIWRLQAKLEAFSGRSKENARIAQDLLFGVENGRKFLTGEYEALLDPQAMAKKAEAEKQIRARVAANPTWNRQWGGAWDRIAKAQQAHREIYTRKAVVDVGGTLFDKAQTIVRLAEELPKPSGERLKEYRDSNLESVYAQLYSEAPIYPGFEEARVQWSISQMAEKLGADDPTVQTALGDKSLLERAHELVAGSRLADVQERKRLVEGGLDAVGSSDDPMIQLALALDPEMRHLRERYENEVESVERSAYSDIAAAYFAVYGDSVYPDATFTLRMTFGPIKGYEESGVEIPAYTTIEGLYQRAAAWDDEAPFNVPESWRKAERRVDQYTPYNFVLCVDIIGGNSGSPVVNREGEVIGLIFDGNLHFRGTGIYYDDTLGRAIAVDSRAITEALNNVYHARPLVKELTGTH